MIAFQILLVAIVIGSGIELGRRFSGIIGISVLISLVIGLALSLSPLAGAHDKDWRETNREFFKDCLPVDKFKKFEEVNPALLTTVCIFSKISELEYRHISDVRKSYHHKGGALDFYFGDYSGMNDCEKLTHFESFFTDFIEALKWVGFDKKSGIGGYPHNKWTPAIHLDARGFPTYWVRLPDGGDKYFTNTDDLLGYVAGVREKHCPI